MKQKTTHSKLRVALRFCAGLLISLLILEVTTRIIFSFSAGTAALFYGMNVYDKQGIKSSEDIVLKHYANREDTKPAQQGEYFKFSPGQVRMAVVKGAENPEDNGTRYEIQMNNFGFRGEDFQKDKPPQVMRVLTLGASSTFGYSNRDQETYPYYLQRSLNERIAKEGCRAFKSVQVYNFGIPHLQSNENLSLLLSEGLTFQPDIVTFYEGANDIRNWRDDWRTGLVYPLARKLLLVHFLSWSAKSWTQTFTAADVATQIDGKPHKFISNVEQMKTLLDRNDISFVPVLQQCSAAYHEEPEILRGLTYSEEVARIERLLAEGKRITHIKMIMLQHAEIMHQYRSWLEAENVAFVDFIATLDGERDLMTSWVHLSSKANQLLARDLSRHIWSIKCGENVGSHRKTIQGQPHKEVSAQ
jgi:lysophospholipase L1-like esterase